MTADEFKKDMINPKKVYCLVSTDSKMIDLYINRFKTAINAEVLSYNKICPVGKLLRKTTLNILYMPKLNEDIFNRNEYIFIHTDSIDKRTSVYKKYKNQIIELSNNYVKYIMDHSDMTETQAIKFSEKCKNDLGIIEQSLYIYNNFNEQYIDYSNDAYTWVDNFIMNKPLPRYVDSPISLMALLSTNCQNILKIKLNDCNDLNPYIKKCLTPMINYRSEKELASIISHCFYLDCQIKKGLMDINDVIDYLIIQDYNKE